MRKFLYIRLLSVHLGGNTLQTFPCFAVYDIIRGKVECIEHRVFDDAVKVVVHFGKEAFIKLYNDSFRTLQIFELM